MSRLGIARPDSMKLKCRCVVRAAAARPSCDTPRRPRQSFSSRPNALLFDMDPGRLLAAVAFIELDNIRARF
jgi:hypothetical protein